MKKFFLMLLLAVCSATTAWADRQSPVYNIEVCKGGIGEVYVRGWAYDPNQRDQEIQLYITIATALDENDEDYDWISTEEYPDIITRVYRPDVNSAHNLTTGNHGFQVRFPIMFNFAEYDANTVYVKIYARTFEYNPSNPNCNQYEFQLNSPYTAVTVVNDHGEGTVGSPYLIFDADHWDAMADVLADADMASLYDGCYYQLDDNYNQWKEGYNITTPVTKMWGTSSSPFSGNFDGNGKTLNVNLSGTTQVAPFAFTNDATIQDLTVAGNINATQYAGGIVGNGGSGTLTLQNCICSATISGFTIYAGGILGWCEDLTLNMQNCLFLGSFSPGSGAKYHPIALKSDSATAIAPAADGIYYLNTVAPSKGLGDNTVIGAEGVPVSTTLVDGEWEYPVIAIDRQTYYATQHILDIWNTETRTLTVYANPDQTYEQNMNIEHLIISKFVTDIKKDAFESCKKLKTVTFEEGSQLERIGESAFNGCQVLTEITIPASVRTIGHYAFCLCRGLISFTVAEGSQLESIGENTFAVCEKLSSVAFLGVTPPKTPTNAFAPGVDTPNTKFYFRGAEYKTDDFWGEVYDHGTVGSLDIIYKLTVGAGVSVITAPTFTSEGNIYYGEGTTVILTPGNYTVTDADGNDITTTVLKGLTLTMPSCDVTVTGQSEVEEDLTISTEEEWNTFVSKVNRGASYVTSTVTLAADISVSTMVGTAEHPFCGTFDGAGHTLNVAISSTEQYAAPFSHIELATIKNLTVTGSVSSSGNYAAGLVGGCALTNTISNCTVRTSVSGASYAGGIVGHGGSVKLTLVGCVFGGSISGFTNYAGGLMGWCDALTLTIDDCLMTGTFTPGSLGQYHPIACKSSGSTVEVTTFKHVYYLNTATSTATGDFIIVGAEGNPVSAVLELDAWDEPVTGADGNTYYTSHIVGKNLPYTYGFETALDTEGWTMVGGPLSSIRPGMSHGGSYSFYALSSFEDDNPLYLISPKIDTQSYVMVSFYISDVTMQVGYSTTDSDIGSFTWVDYQLDFREDWNLCSVPLPAGIKYVAFRLSSGAVKIDDISFEVMPPTNIATSNLTKTECTLTWTYPAAAAIGFAYQYKKAADDVWSDEVTTTEMSAILSGLTINTEYDFRVKALFVNNTSSIFSTFRFITEDNPVTLPFYEGFENGMKGWRIVDSAPGTGIVAPATNFVCDGSNSFKFDHLKLNQYLVSPQIENNSPDRLWLIFSYRNYDSLVPEINLYYAVFKVGYSTTTKDLSAFKWLPSMKSSQSWQAAIFDLPADVKYIAIKLEEGNDLFLDKFVFQKNPTPPQQLTVTNVTGMSADVSWNSDTGYYYVGYRQIPLFFDDFENGLDQWKIVRNGEGTANTDWRKHNLAESTSNWATGHSGTYVALSISYDYETDIDYSVDNWLISPQVTLNGTLKFWVHDSGHTHEPFDVYVSTTTDDINAFTKIGSGVSTNSWTAFTFDLSSYRGEQGYIAIRHQSKGHPFFAIDDVGIYLDDGNWKTKIATRNNCRLTELRPLSDYEIKVSPMIIFISWSEVATFTTNRIVPIYDNEDNNEIIDAMAAHTNDAFGVMLLGRTLYKDGDWNTLCLPFGVSDLNGTPLEGATVKTLDNTALSDEGTLTLNFTDATGIEAGRPYILKWDLPMPDFIIRSTSDWETFAQNVNNGTESYQGKLVQLATDISVSTMAGTADHPFCGTFDGAGHTINLSISGAEYAAPFRYINGATVCNLEVTGSVNGGQYSAGIVGAALGGTNSIRNCWMAASVTSQGNSIGGILGHGTTSVTTISNCYLTGHLRANDIGVFCDGGSNGGTFVLETCWAIGEYTKPINAGSLNLIFTDSGGTVTVTDCRHNSDEITQGGQYTLIGSPSEASNKIVDFLGGQWTLDDNGELALKHTTDVANITNPVFKFVRVSNTITPVETNYVDFIGITSPFSISGEDRTILFLGSGSTLYYPSTAMTFNACRAYFQLNGLTVGDGTGDVKAFNLNIDDSTDGVRSIENGKLKDENEAGGWYTLDGCKVSKPAQRGIYIHNGKKIVIK